MRPWRLYLLLALTGLILLTAIRLAFFYTNNHELTEHPEGRGLLIGLRYDICILSYWLAPLLLLNVMVTSAVHERWRQVAETVWLTIGTGTILLVGLADVGWYGYFHSHLNMNALEYGKNPGQAFDMIWSTPAFRWLTLAFLVFWPLLALFMRAMLRKWKPRNVNNRARLQVAGFCYMAFAFLGMRGGITGRPIGITDHRYSNTGFFNDMAVNPVFYLYQQSVNSSFADIRDGGSAQDSLSRILNQQSLRLSRPLVDSASLKGRNVVIIMMESMAAWKTRLKGQEDLTPFLNELASRSVYFDSFFSIGEHTYNGVFSVLTGHPGLMGRHMLRLAEHKDLPGLPGATHDAGYFNIFQIPHGGNFDNMNDFLSRHYFDSVTDHNDLPADLKGGNRWGVCDHRLYSYGIRNMNRLTATGQKVLSVLMSISDHPPYELPSDAPAEIRCGDPKKEAVRYADWSLRRFMDSAANTSWYRNTVFVFVGDHGQPQAGNEYPLPLGSHHVPCLIFAPASKLKPQRISSLASQTDLFPTLAWLLGLPADNNTQGVNQMTTRRNWVSFYSDAWMGCLNNRQYHVLDEFGNSSLYDMKDESRTDRWNSVPGVLRPAAMELHKNLRWSVISAEHSLRLNEKRL